MFWRKKRSYGAEIEAELNEMRATLPQDVKERIRIQNHLILSGFTLEEAQEAYEEMIGVGGIWGTLEGMPIVYGSFSSSDRV